MPQNTSAGEKTIRTSDPLDTAGLTLYVNSQSGSGNVFTTNEKITYDYAPPSGFAGTFSFNFNLKDPRGIVQRPFGVPESGGRKILQLTYPV